MNDELRQVFRDVPGIDLWEYDNGNSGDSYWVRPGAILRISVKSVNFQTWDMKMFVGAYTHARTGLKTEDIPERIAEWNNIYTLWAVHSQ